MKATVLAALLTAAAASSFLPAMAEPTATRTVSIADHVVTVGDQRVRYLEAGSGDTVILLLHGWPANADDWRRVIPLLANRYRVVAPDLRGIGGSSSPSRDFSKAALAGDLHAFVQTLGARRLIVVGHDIGGMVSYAYARRFPAEVAGVAILDVPIPGFAPWDAIAQSSHAWHYDFHSQDPLAEELVAGRQRIYFRYFIDKTAGNARAIDDAEIARFARAYGTSAQLSAGFGLYRTFDVDKAYNVARTGPMGVPLLVAGADRGMGDGTAALAQSLRQAGASKVSVAMIAGSGHWVADEQPRIVAKLVGDFAASTDR